LTHQTFENIEILAVDDCSTDSTLEILERYAVKDQRVRVTRNKQNLGLVGNWNRCVELAQTEWIKFVFQDDVIKPTCIEHMLAAAQATKSLITACRREFIFESVPDQLRDEYRKFVEELTLDNACSSKTLISASEFCGKVLRYGSANFIGEPTSLLIHRDAFVKYGAFNANLIQLCDLEYWYRVGVNEGITFSQKHLCNSEYTRPAPHRLTVPCGHMLRKFWILFCCSTSSLSIRFTPHCAVARSDLFPAEK